MNVIFSMNVDLLDTLQGRFRPCGQREEPERNVDRAGA
jgi:hypothetical protein